jgi:integrase
MIDESVAKRRRAKDRDGLHKRRGIWHFRLRVDGRWKEYSTHTTSYEEARAEKTKAERTQEEGRLPTDMAKWPFEKAAQEWLAGRSKMVAIRTLQIDKERLVPLRKAFVGRRLEEIVVNGGRLIRSYQLKRTEQVGNRTINLETKALRMILRSAKLWPCVAEDYRALPEGNRGPGRALTPEEEKRLWNAANSNPNWLVAYCAALVAANTTARGCEIKGLRIADVDLTARTMQIRRASTKTDAGCRIVPLNATATWALARLLERATALGAISHDCYLLPAFRFRRTKEPSSAGAGFDVTAPMRSWRSAWRKLTKAAGLGGLRFHDLRHHCITKLAEAGVAEQTLMAIAGHVSREMLEHYSHIRMQAKREAVESLENTAVQPEPHQQVTIN